MKNLSGYSKAVSKVVFIAVAIVLIIAFVALGFVMSTRIDSLQTDKTSLQNQITTLQASNSQLQNNYNQLNAEYQQYQSIARTQNLTQISQLSNLQSQIASLQSQLSNATALITQLQGPTGILPTYMDLGIGAYTGAYWLELSLKNTGPVPITQIFVTLNSIQLPMTFTYLNASISANAPLPPYETATARENASPCNIDNAMYPLVIQAVANNGTIYTYQTTIHSH